ncbi:flagellar export chaperone FlgN [Spirochaeta cellobiosiphila]|uniref:flagellar export chaperone FlgN n=1 Tax=Spirochaeta cellobiosiphila TaxID=504483 RepID=UPI00040C1078|nr:flagellar export chaperone FlgN [Spirochaeta cellobiosiphila]
MVPEHCESLINTMEEQHNLLLSFQKEEEILKKYINDKDWNGLQESLVTLEKLSMKMEQAESQRFELYRQLCTSLNLSSDTPFYRTVADVDTAHREELIRIYRQIKVVTIQIKGQSKGMQDYLDVTTNTIKFALQEIFPHKKGNLYNTAGKKLEANHQALFLNKQL